MKIMKVLAVASMISLGALSMVACQKTEPDIKIEKDIQGTGIGDVEVTIGGNKESQTFANGYTVQFTDPSKSNYRVPGYALDKNGNYDEKTWEKGPNGFKVPPEGIRTYYSSDNPDRYEIPYYNEEQGELKVRYLGSSRDVRSGDIKLARNGNSKDTIDDILQFVNAMDKAGKASSK